MTEFELKDTRNLNLIIFNEVQLLLAEKRTSLAFLRTGIAVFALPLSVLSALIATSKYYNFMQVVHLLIPLLLICLGLVVLGIYLVTRAVLRIRHFDQSINDLKKNHKNLAEYLD